MSRTTQRELEDLVAVLATATGVRLDVDRYQPGDSRTPYRIESEGGRLPFGERRRSAAELADCVRFALCAIGVANATAERGRLTAGQTQGDDTSVVESR